MDENASEGDKSEDLQYELQKLKMDLKKSNAEKANAAEYGLVILDETNMLKSILEQKDATLENLRAQLICAQETLAAMQQHNKALEEADIIEEEKRIINEERVKKERDELEGELRNFKKQLVQNTEERDKFEELLRQSHLSHEKTKLQFKKMKEDLKEYESRENYALKNCDILESDNLELQLQVSQLLKSLQQFDIIQSENKRLLEKVEELSSDFDRLESLKFGMEKSLSETNDMLKDERELKMRYKRELDAQVLGNEGSFLKASTVASLHSLIEGPSSMVGDFSVDNISALLDGYVAYDDDAHNITDRNVDAGSKVDDRSNDMNDSLEDLAFEKEQNDGNAESDKQKVKSRKAMSKDLMSELMMTQDDYILNIEKLEMEKLMLNKTIEDLRCALDSCSFNEVANETPINADDQLKTYSQGFEVTEKSVTVETLTSATQTPNNNEDLEDAMSCLQNLRRHLLDMVTEAQSTYTSLCNSAGESLNSKAMMHVDARKTSIEGKTSHRGRDVSERHIPLFTLSKSLPKSDSHIGVENESVSNIEMDCTKLLASSVDLMRYSRRVANRILDSKIAARSRESSLMSPSLDSSLYSSTSEFQMALQTPSTVSSNFEFQERIFQQQHLLAAKTEQMMSLRQMLSANKIVYESSIEKLKQQHCDEMRMKMKLIEDLRRTIDELREKEGIKHASEQSLIKQCDHYSCLINDLNERLSSSELERKTLNSILRIAIQHKLLLLKKLQSHGISVELYAERDSSADRSDSRRLNLPSYRQPMVSRYSSSPSSPLKPSSFAPLLYCPSKNK